MLICESLLIDYRTLALESFYLENNKSKITTSHGVYYSKMAPLDLLETACNRYASTMDGRKQAVIKLLNYYRKTPFLIIPFELGVFPTMSPDHLDCVWIFNQRFEIDEYEKGKSILTFSNGTKIEVAASKHTLMKQQQRLHTIIDTYRMIDRENNRILMHETNRRER